MLICPGCQGACDWAADLDDCQVCGSVRLVRRLGEVECRDCGAVWNPAADQSAVDPVSAAGQPSDLADEVEQALARVLGPSRQRHPYAMS